MQDLNLPEWRLIAMFINARDSSAYISIQIDVIPDSLEGKKLLEAKHVSEYC